jgi:hypothetical protein
LRTEAASIRDLEIEKDQVSCFFPRDLLPTGLGEEIIIYVDSLFDRPSRTIDVQNQLAAALVRITDHHFTRDPLIVKCYIRPFNRATSGYSEFRRRMK